MTAGFNVGVAAVVFVAVFAGPAGVIAVDFWLQKSEAGLLNHHIEAWAQEHGELAVFMLVGVFALLGHFLFSSVITAPAP